MSSIISETKKEIERLEKMLVTINKFRKLEPEGCLKYQNKGNKTFFYQQYRNEINKKWERKYIKRENLSLVKRLAQKHYYTMLEPIIKETLRVLKNFLHQYHPEKKQQVYDDLSDVRKSLVVPMVLSKEENVRKWCAEKYKGNDFHQENLRYETEQGELVRSKSEVIIANILHQHREDILYKYERPLEVLIDGNVKTIYPDFTILNIHSGCIVYWEHAGRLDDPYYASEFVKKMNTYVSNDLLPGRDVVITVETLGNPLDVSVVKRLVKEIEES